MTNWQSIYRQKIQTLGYSLDDTQLDIINIFARIDSELTNNNIIDKEPIKNKLFDIFSKKPVESKHKHVKGLYCYGDVGRGKTFLLDLFCENTKHKVKRIHFHAFMKEIHDALNLIKHESNPLKIVATEIYKNIKVLCIDEFFVSDITDAMILYKLLQTFIELDIVIITTSNLPPDDLYKNGLQRARFLPAIELIKDNLELFNIARGQDYRRLFLTMEDCFLYPHSLETIKKLEYSFRLLSNNKHVDKNGVININKRKVSFVACSSDVIWFDFATLCESNRSQLDYLWLADNFHAVILSDIPVLDKLKEDAARRFLSLIDVLYDKRITLLISSALPIEQIYIGEKIVFEFERLKSRLFEMRSIEYLNSNKLI